ncbi:hypothetical protein Tco_1275459 [Tanacetum coccineum]
MLRQKCRFSAEPKGTGANDIGSSCLNRALGQEAAFLRLTITLYFWNNQISKQRYGYVKYYKKTVKNGQKRTRERMSDHEAKENQASAQPQSKPKPISIAY